MKVMFEFFTSFTFAEEWVTRKKSEVTTTRQIATRVKRELILEDGRILSDSGPKISTSVNEDTHTTNYQQTEVYTYCSVYIYYLIRHP